jgi:gamma-glutamyltranspeptidase/glutathione hydrolase
MNGHADMAGAVACGHPETAAAACEILADGGNAFDAVLAALCASTVTEPVLSSLGGGGFLLARHAGGEAVLYDFFAQTPRTRRPVDDIDFYPILADFGTATQEFHIGLGAVATPGVVKGLFAAHADLASLPIARLIEPAVRLARQGVRLRPIDTYLFQVVGPILSARPEGRALYRRPDGTPLAEGDALRQPDLADTLEALAREGDALFYHGDIGRRLIADCAGQGGHLTDADLRGYAVIKRRPLVRRYRGAEVLLNPPPSSGGILIAFALELLSRHGIGDMVRNGPELISLLARVMTSTNRARVESRLHEAVADAEEDAAAARLLDPGLLARYAREVAPAPASPRGTTHISVVDSAGNLAALSVSNGEGCGYIVPGTGIVMNNMLGEEDLNPHGFHAWPEGCRMSSMMCPTLAQGPDGTVAALGSGGSNRIRTAILQVLVNLLDHHLPAEMAVDAPRLHVEGGIASLEDGFADGAAAALEPLADRVVLWPRHNLFFGGVHAVVRHPDGRLEAAGDPRRDGCARQA